MSFFINLIYLKSIFISPKVNSKSEFKLLLFITPASLISTLFLLSISISKGVKSLSLINLPLYLKL